MKTPRVKPSEPIYLRKTNQETGAITQAIVSPMVEGQCTVTLYAIPYTGLETVTPFASRAAAVNALRAKGFRKL